jgi:mannose/fructose/N-acetylgalactosamine-specific phosphotransferase system component IID
MRGWLKNTFQQAAWAPLAVFVFYAVAAKGFSAYLLYPWLDMPTHFCGGLAITYFYTIAIAHSQAHIGRIPRLIHLLALLGLTAITAVVWEFVEFSADVALGTKMNLGVTDTLSDLFFGLLGGVVMVAVAARCRRIEPGVAPNEA